MHSSSFLFTYFLFFFIFFCISCCCSHYFSVSLHPLAISFIIIHRQAFIESLSSHSFDSHTKELRLSSSFGSGRSEFSIGTSINLIDTLFKSRSFRFPLSTTFFLFLFPLFVCVFGIFVIHSLCLVILCRASMSSFAVVRCSLRPELALKVPTSKFLFTLSVNDFQTFEERKIEKNEEKENVFTFYVYYHC